MGTCTSGPPTEQGFPLVPFCPIPGVPVGLSAPDGPSCRSELPIPDAGALARNLSLPSQWSLLQFPFVLRTDSGLGK